MNATMRKKEREREKVHLGNERVREMFAIYANKKSGGCRLTLLS